MPSLLNESATGGRLSTAVVQSICNRKVGSSILSAGTIFKKSHEIVRLFKKPVKRYQHLMSEKDAITTIKQMNAAGDPGGGFTHRIDIDGLRAIAVIAVVLFHAGIVPGGFVGVDIFFVISGYLMAAITAEKFRRGEFSFSEFYARRARRILPAYLVMIFVTGLLGSLFFLPFDVKDLGRAMIAAGGFYSNVVFYTAATDYFESDALIYQPLLHTWSLCIEAQFYLLFPLMMAAFYRYFSRSLFGALSIVAALSFVLSIIAVCYDPKSAFYLLPARMWELLLGAMVFYAPAIPQKKRNIAAAGFALMLGCIVSFNSSLAFPGALALGPTIGAALVLLAFTNLKPSGLYDFLLSARPVSFIANISYSLYLWHWPLFVLARYRFGADLSLMTTTGIILISVILAVLSWRIVEKKFLRDALPAKPLSRLAIPLLMVFLMMLAGVTVKNIVAKYMTGQIPAKAVSYVQSERDYIKGDCLPEKDKALIDQIPCRMGNANVKPEYFLWGNSFARMWAPGIDLAARENNVAVVSGIKSACLPLLDEKESTREQSCKKFNDQVYDYLKDASSLHTVILAGNWYYYRDFESDLAGTLEKLKAAGKEIYILMPPPSPGYHVPRSLALAALRGKPVTLLTTAQHESNSQELRTVVLRLKEMHGFEILDPADVMCRGGNCQIEENGQALYYDSMHISVHGAKYFHGMLEPVFE